jgi:hypothetical protein
MLCGISVVFNSFADEFGLMRCNRSSENRQVLIGFQSTKAFGRLQHAGVGPAQCHRGISPIMRVDPTGKNLRPVRCDPYCNERFWGVSLNLQAKKLINGNVLLR